VQGQAGICKPATPKCHPLPDQNPYAKGERRPSTIKSKGKLQLILFVFVENDDMWLVNMVDVLVEKLALDHALMRLRAKVPSGFWALPLCIPSQFGGWFDTRDT
jgi:hypothetical protein